MGGREGRGTSKVTRDCTLTPIVTPTAPMTGGSFCPLTQHGQASHFVHEKSGHDVTRQHGQGPQEVDEVDPVGTVVVIKRHLATRLVVHERAVDHLRAVDQLGVIDVWPDDNGRRQRSLRDHRAFFFSLLVFFFFFRGLTGVIELRIDEGAVTEEGAHRRHVVEDAVTKGRVDEGHRLQLHVEEPGNGGLPLVRLNQSEGLVTLLLWLEPSYRSLIKSSFLCI